MLTLSSWYINSLDIAQRDGEREVNEGEGVREERGKS